MDPLDLMKKALEAWDVEIGPPEMDPEDLTPRRTLTYRPTGERLKVEWRAETHDDLVAMTLPPHNADFDPAVEIAMMILRGVFEALRTKKIQ